jgi:hypothetical protein
MKGLRSFLWLAVIVGLASCAGPPPFNIDNDIWGGVAVCPDNPEVSITLTFSQEGETIEGVLQLNATTRTLSGTLKGTALDISTATEDPSVVGTFDRNARTFSGTLQFPNGATTVDCTLTMSYQSEQQTGMGN